MKKHVRTPIFVFGMLLLVTSGFTSLAHVSAAVRFKVVVIAEYTTADQHYAMVTAAKAWFAKLATDSNITVDWVVDPSSFTDAYLANYQVVVQINYPPFSWSTTAEAAFQKYMEQGKGGWIGTHHASLYGQNVTPVGQPLWTWMQTFLGGITYQNYIAGLASATVRLEDTLHPCMKGVPKSFTVTNDEWYTWSPNPRTNSNIHVIGNVDQNSYSPKRGTDPVMANNDHPVIWTNTSSAYKARNIYMFMGHSPDCYSNAAYTTIMRNAVFWAATTTTNAKDPKVSQLRGNHSLLMDIRTDRQYVSLQIPGAGSVHGTLTDANGRIMAQAEGLDGSCRFDRRSISAGVYLLQAKAREGTLSRRLFIN